MGRNLAVKMKVLLIADGESDLDVPGLEVIRFMEKFEFLILGLTFTIGPFPSSWLCLSSTAK